MFNLDRAFEMMHRLPIRDFYTQALIPFRPYESQRRVMTALRDQHLAGKPMRVIVLKSRRQGISTLIDSLLVLHCMARSGAKSTIITHDYKSSQELFDCPKMIVNDCIEGGQPLKTILGMPEPTQHKIIFPHYKTDKRGAKRSDDSSLAIATAGNVEGGRGARRTDLHLSELAFYPSDKTFAALLPTVPKSHDTMVVIESTANGRVGTGEPFYKFWEASRKGETDFTPVFLSWLEDPNNVDYNTPVLDAPKDDEEKLLMREGVLVNGKLHKATLPQIAWRRAMINSPVCRGYEDIFDQEYPRDETVAFVSTGEPAFTKEEMTIARNSLLTHPARVEIGKENDHIYCRPNSVSPILQWEPPQKDHRYYFGVDAARGKDEGDFAAIVGIDGESGHQVLRYAQRVDPEYLARLCNYIGLYYNRGMLCIELTGNLGLWCQSRLRDYFHYPNLYRWRGTRDDKIAPGATAGRKGGSYGWETTYRSRERLLITFRESIIHRMCTVRDEEVVRQMDVATRKDSWERWEIAFGHDDILMAYMLANISRSEWHPRRPEGATSAVTSDADHDSRALARLNPQSTFEHVGEVTAAIYKQLLHDRDAYDRHEEQKQRGWR